MRNAEQLIGAPVQAGVIVNPKGRGKAVMSGAALGQLAGSAAKAAAEMRYDRASLSGALGYLALTDSELVLLNARTGLAKPKATGVAARVPRAHVSSAAVGEGKLTVPLRVSFEDGSAWELEVGRAYAKQARSFEAALATAR